MDAFLFVAPTSSCSCYFITLSSILVAKISVEIDSITGAVASCSVFSPHSVAIPGVDVPVGIEKRHNDEGNIAEVSVELAVLGFVQKPLAVGGRDPFSSVKTAIDGDDLGSGTNFDTEHIPSFERRTKGEVASECFRVGFDGVVVVVLQKIVDLFVVSRENFLDVNLFLEVLNGEFVLEII